MGHIQHATWACGHITSLSCVCPTCRVSGADYYRPRYERHSRAESVATSIDYSRVGRAERYHREVLKREAADRENRMRRAKRYHREILQREAADRRQGATDRENRMRKAGRYHREILQREAAEKRQEMVNEENRTKRAERYYRDILLREAVDRRKLRSRRRVAIKESQRRQFQRAKEKERKDREFSREQEIYQEKRWRQLDEEDCGCGKCTFTRRDKLETMVHRWLATIEESEIVE